MNGVNIPFLPASLWLMAGALTIMLLLVMLGYYIYWRKREKALIKNVDNVAELSAQEQILRADVEAIRKWMDDQKVELERLNSERDHQERIRANLSDLEQQCARKDQENQALRNEVGELENQRYILSQTLDKTKQEVGDLEAKRSEAQAIEARLVELRLKYEEVKGNIKNLAELEVKNDILLRENTKLEEKVKFFKQENELVMSEMNRNKSLAETARIEAEKEQAKLSEMLKEKAELSVILDTLRHEQTALNRDIERLEDKIEGLRILSKEALGEAKNHSALKKKSEDEALKASNELLSLQKEKRLLDVELSELRSRKTILEQEVMRLEGTIVGRPEEPADFLAHYADLVSNSPTCLVENAFERQRDMDDEVSVLQQVQNDLRKEGLIFPSRVINAFHTSLKCHDINPLTVLAGVSGTGKTLLPMRYAELMGMHRLVMAVQPRWDSPQDMFGFYNYLEKEYKATDLSRSLIRMDPYNYNGEEFAVLDSDWAKNRLLLVLLDEMNLARTEYYFSDFLSKLELRREVRDRTVKHERSQAEIELDTGPGKTRFHIWVGDNVLFVGTMNEDETTQSLSDKVLDRANVIRFGRPDERARSNRNYNKEHNGSSKFITIDQWRSWHKETTGRETWHDTVVDLTQRLNGAMDQIGRPFGFRVQQAIEQYVNNYPLVSVGNRYKLAIADQLEQKIIPKLRGLDVNSDHANQCLGEIETVIADLEDDELGSAFGLARTESYEMGMFQWRGVTRKYEEMPV